MGSEGLEDVSLTGSDDAGMINGLIKHIMEEVAAEKEGSVAAVDTSTGAVDVSFHEADAPVPMDCSDVDVEGKEKLDEEAKDQRQVEEQLQVWDKKKETADCVVHAKDISNENGKALEVVEPVKPAGSEDTEDASGDEVAVVDTAADVVKCDVGKAKKPLAPFLQFSNEQRAQVKKDHPDASFREMNVLLGDKWKHVSEEEKKMYETKYQVDKEAYMKGLQGAVQETRVTRKVESKSRRKQKDPDKPKHQITAFFAFGNVRRPALLAEKISVPEIGKRLGDEWKSMSEDARCVYEKIAAQDKIRYATELEAYKKKKAEEALALQKQMEERKAEYALQCKQKNRIDMMTKNSGTQQLLKEQRTSQRKRSKIDDEPDKPKKPPTAYLLFGHEVRQAALKENPSLNFVDINTIVSTKWRELVEDEKQKWLDKAAASLDRYKNDLSEYYAKRRAATEASTGS